MPGNRALDPVRAPRSWIGPLLALVQGYEESTYTKRKLVRVGDSLTVTLPAEVARESRLEKEMTGELSVHPRTGAVTISHGVRGVEDGGVTEDFDRAIDELVERRAELYRRLAK
jgi:hypothetical protein